MMNKDFPQSSHVPILTVFYETCRSGGDAYEDLLSCYLRNSFLVSECKIKPAGNGLLGWTRYALEPVRLLALYRKQFEARAPLLSVKTFDAALLPFWPRSRSIVIVHHMGFEKNKHAWLYRQIESYIERSLRQADALVVVSEYWRRYFVKRDFKNVHTIYNPFRVEQFAFDHGEVEEFKARHGLSQKPIVYLGNGSAHKGIEKALASLKSLDAHFIVTGMTAVSFPSARYLCLSRRDYALLLKASTVVLAMSEFDEGWCRTAHEALLCRTPVIGSGSGGMRELLEGGGQVVCTSFNELKDHVVKIMESPQLQSSMGDTGYEFAREFTLQRFHRDWANVIQQVVGPSPARPAQVSSQ